MWVRVGIGVRLKEVWAEQNFESCLVFAMGCVEEGEQPNVEGSARYKHGVGVAEGGRRECDFADGERFVYGSIL